METQNTPMTADQIAAAAEAAEAAKKAADENAAAQAAKDKKAADAKAAKEAKEAAKEAKKVQREADAAAKKAAKEAEKAAKEASKQPEQNGVRRPKPNTKTGTVWDMADRMSLERQAPVAIGDLHPVLKAMGLNDHTIRTQYAHWRTFNGVSGRIEKVATPMPAAATATEATAPVAADAQAATPAA